LAGLGVDDDAHADERMYMFQLVDVGGGQEAWRVVEQRVAPA
jgi:hypothetical protein